MRSSVDLPAPLGPSSAVTPGPTAKLTSDTATTSPNHLLTPWTTMVAASPTSGVVTGTVTSGAVTSATVARGPVTG